MNKHTDKNAVWFTSSLFDEAAASGQTDAYRLCHGFSTRHGGMSRDPYLEDLNLGFSVGEDRKITVENYGMFSTTLGIKPGHVLCAYQTHTAAVLPVTADDCGMGLDENHPRPGGVYADGFDALVTSSRDTALTVRAADCVPILFWDPVHAVIGAAHAGWRGTFGKIAAETVSAMEALGANRQTVLVSIGHAIGVCCYEVDDAFYERFSAAFGKEICDSVFVRSPHFSDPAKYHCDLRALNRRILTDFGVPPEHIEVSALCTCCNPALFFSHRYAVANQGGKRGLMGAMISMEQR